MATAARQSQIRNAAASNQQRLQRTSQQQGMYLIALVVSMIGLTYASVPLYRYPVRPLSFLVPTAIDMNGAIVRVVMPIARDTLHCLYV